MVSEQTAAPTAAAAQKQKLPKNKAVSKDEAAVVGVVPAPVSSAGKRAVKPDRIAYNQAVEDLTRDIDATKAKIDELKDSIANLGTNDKQQQDKLAINEKIEAVRAEQSKFQEARSAIQDQLKATGDATKRKIDDIKSARDKMSYRSTADIDRRIVEIEAQINTGKLKLPEEKRLLQDITTLRKQRKALDLLGPQETSIEADRKKADELRKKLDALEPEYKQFKKQLDDLYAELRECQSERTDFQGKLKVLRNERDGMSNKMSDLLQQRKNLHTKFRKENDEFNTFWREEKARKDLEYKKQRDEQNRFKKLESVRRALELAEVPAYESEILLCTNLIHLLQGYVSPQKDGVPVAADAVTQKPAEAAVVHDALPKGVAAATVLKKKSDRDSENLFAGNGGKKKAAPKKEKDSSKEFKFDFHVIDQFFKLKIDVPMKPADVPKTVEALDAKKKHFIENQERVTKENIEKAKKMEQEVLKSLDAPEVAVEEVAAADAVEETPAA